MAASFSGLLSNASSRQTLLPGLYVMPRSLITLKIAHYPTSLRFISLCDWRQWDNRNRWSAVMGAFGRGLWIVAMAVILMSGRCPLPKDPTVIVRLLVYNVSLRLYWRHGFLPPRPSSRRSKEGALRQ